MGSEIWWTISHDLNVGIQRGRNQEKGTGVALNINDVLDCKEITLHKNTFGMDGERDSVVMMFGVC